MSSRPLEQRIEELEQRVADLEHRVIATESLPLIPQRVLPWWQRPPYVKARSA